MAAPIPYVGRAYDNRQHTGRMSDLIGRQGEINAQGAYDRGQNTAARWAVMGDLIGGAVTDVAKVHAAESERKKVEGKKAAREDMLKMVADLPEDQQVDELRKGGYDEDADKKESMFIQRSAARTQGKLNDLQLSREKWESALGMINSVGALPPEQQAAAWAKVAPQVKDLAGDKFGGMVPDTWDANLPGVANRIGMTAAQNNALMREATTAAAMAKVNRQNALAAAHPSLSKMLTAPGMDQGSWDAVLAHADSIGVGPEARAKYGATFSEEAVKKVRATTLGDTPNTSDEMRVAAFAQSRGKRNASEMNAADWAAFDKIASERKIAEARATHVPPADPNRVTPSNVITAWNAMNSRISDLRIERDRAAANQYEENAAAKAQTHYAAEVKRAEDMFRSLTGRDPHGAPPVGAGGANPLAGLAPPSGTPSPLASHQPRPGDNPMAGPPGPPPPPPPRGGGSLTVKLPNGSVKTFPSQAALDAYKKAERDAMRAAGLQ